MTQQKRILYWYSAMLGLLHREKETMLNEHGFDVRFFQTPESLFQELQKRRAGIIIIGDEGDEASVLGVIKTLMNDPDIQGARLILSTINRHQKALQFAGCAGFRDIIPLALSPKLWLQRFSYATAGRPIPLNQPYPQVVVNHVATVALPARIVWVNQNRLWIECRARPPKGSTFHLRGALADALGEPNLTVTVEENHRNHLRYRFSDAIVATMRLPESAEARAKKVLAEMMDGGSGPRYRVFLAMQTASIRRKLATQLDAMQFEVGTALQKQAIVDEPRFFSPDVVFIENVLCREANRIDQLLKNLEPKVPVIITGEFPEIDSVRRRFPDRRLFAMQDIPGNLGQLMFTVYLADNDKSHQAGVSSLCHVPSSSPMSLAEVSFSARLTQLHPLAAQLALPFPIGHFGLARIESPVLARITDKNPFCKITECYSTTKPGNETFPWVAESFLSDLDDRYTQRLAQSLVLLMAEQLGVRDFQPGSASKLGAAPGMRLTAQSVPAETAAPTPVQETAAAPTTTVTPQPSAPTVTMASPQAAASPVVTTTEAPSVTYRPKTPKKKPASAIDAQIVKASLIMAALAGVFGVLMWWLANREITNPDGEEYTDFFRRMSPARFSNPTRTPEPQ